MKEIIAVIRPSKIEDTKKALEAIGIPAFTGRKVVGRGRAAVNITQDNITMVKTGMVPKRMFIIEVKDEDVDKVVETILLVNSTKMPGDGKIFVLPVTDAYRISTGKAASGRN